MTTGSADVWVRTAETDGDRERADALLHENNARGDAPPLHSADEWSRQPGYLLRYWLSEGDGGRARGAAVLLRQAWRPEGVFSLQVAVAPPERGRGVGDALYREALASARALLARCLLAEVDGNDTAALGFAARCGFAVTQQFRTMVLNVAAFPMDRFAPLVERAAHTGVRVFSFVEIGDTPENRRRLYELNRRLAPDIPGNGDDFPAFDEYEREVLEADWFRSEGQFIAAARDPAGLERWVGLVGIGFDPEAKRATHEFTAVDQAFRGRGVAQALKVRSIGYAASLGARELVTGNDALNAAMLAINRKLGYREHLGAARLERDLEPERD